MPPLQTRSRTSDYRGTKQKKYATQRSILKNSQERNNEELEILEAKKQMILRRRRLFSHYRQYEQWRRRQFSYDPCYFRANPLPIGQAACGDYYTSYGAATGINTGTGAFRRRRQYRRQYSCTERSHEGSRESRESSSLQKGQSMMASDTLNTDSSTMNQQTTNKNNQQIEHISHFHLLHEERSTSISERCTRSRINSAIFVSSEGRGFDSIEFLRRHGSQSVLCRKARSAENITDNGRKKSFADQRQWRTDEEAEHKERNEDSAETDIELQESRIGGDLRTLSVLNSNAEQTTAVTTAANVIVGSISIEAPPYTSSHDDVRSVNSVKMPATHASIASTTSASHDSTDTVEELIVIPKTTTTAAVTAVGAAAPPLPLPPPPTATIITSVAAPPTTSERKSRVLVHQRSSTASPMGSRSESPSKPLNLKFAKPKICSNLPMVSVSGPSPQDEKPECL